MTLEDDLFHQEKKVIKHKLKLSSILTSKWSTNLSIFVFHFPPGKMCLCSFARSNSAAGLPFPYSWCLSSDASSPCTLFFSTSFFPLVNKHAQFSTILKHLFLTFLPSQAVSLFPSWKSSLHLLTFLLKLSVKGQQ